MSISAHPWLFFHQAGGKWVTQVKSVGHSPEAEHRVDLVSKGSMWVNDGRDRSPHP